MSIDIMAPTDVIKHLWSRRNLKCLLCSEQYSLEVRLYEDGVLVALEPAKDTWQAFEISQRWLETPPQRISF